jgi:hypothetical protein
MTISNMPIDPEYFYRVPAISMPLTITVQVGDGSGGFFAVGKRMIMNDGVYEVTASDYIHGWATLTRTN